MSDRHEVIAEIARVYRTVIAGCTAEGSTFDGTVKEMHLEAAAAVWGWLVLSGEVTE